MTATPPSPVERLETEGGACDLHREAPTWSGLRTAALGGFACETGDSGRRLLEAACARLAEEGFEAVVGPMDGSTWHSYRLVVESDGRAPFFLEPNNPDHYPAAFDQAGFERLSEYISAIDHELAPAPEVPAPQGITLRPWRSEDPEGELKRLHALSLRAFAKNPFYRPINFPDFAALYQAVLPLIDPELVLLAESGEGDSLGFLFALPDRLEGPAPQSVILKTYASLQKGIGSLLVDRFYQIARRRGFTAVIHALIHLDNLSALHSQRRGGQAFRRYALWGRRLSP